MYCNVDTAKAREAAEEVGTESSCELKTDLSVNNVWHLDSYINTGGREDIAHSGNRECKWNLLSPGQDCNVKMCSDSSPCFSLYENFIVLLDRV